MKHSHFSKQLRRIVLQTVSLAVVACVASTANAQIFTEAGFGGDFSGDSAAPTALGILAPGTSNVSGAVTLGANNDRDLVTFSIAPGDTLTAVDIQEFGGVGNHFLGLAAGNTAPGAGSEFLFAGLVNVPGTGTPLSLLGNTTDLAFGAPGAPATLGPGDYTLFFNETVVTDPIIFSANLVVTTAVPEPTSGILLGGLGLLGLARRRRR